MEDGKEKTQKSTLQKQWMDHSLAQVRLREEASRHKMQRTRPKSRIRRETASSARSWLPGPCLLHCVSGGPGCQ